MTQRLNWVERMESKQRQRPAVVAARPAVAAAIPVATAAPAPTISDATIVIALRKDRERIRGILEAPEANGREKEAWGLAFESSTDVAKARSILGSLRIDTEADEIDAVARRIAGRVSGRAADNVANASTEVDEIDVMARRIAGRVAGRDATKASNV